LSRTASAASDSVTETKNQEAQEEKKEPATAAEDIDYDNLTPEQQKQVAELEKIQDMAMAQDAALKLACSEAEWARYQSEKKNLEALQKAGDSAKTQELQGQLSQWLSGEVLADTAKHESVAQKIQEFFAKYQQVRIQHKLNAKLRKKKTAEVKAALSEEAFETWSQKVHTLPRNEKKSSSVLNNFNSQP